MGHILGSDTANLHSFEKKLKNNSSSTLLDETPLSNKKFSKLTKGACRNTLNLEVLGLRLDSPIPKPQEYIYMETMKLTPRERVARGVKLLDRRVPEWHKKVKSENLDISNDEECVLGQIFGHYTTGFGKLVLESEEAVECGFYSQESLDLDLKAVEYRELTRCWKEVLIARMLQEPTNDTSPDTRLVAVG
jgi:hypothetical protein